MMSAGISPISKGTVDIPVRHMDFEFDDDIPLFWMGGDPLQTMILTGLSCTFPEGERMFMRAVRNFQPLLKDPTLKAQVRAFLGQEAHHGKEHQSFNEFMARKGLSTLYIDKFVKYGIAREEKIFSKARMLGKTCALEHFTAMFAETLLEHPELIDEMDERLKPLWFWHAIEESEHKSVAFDVFKDQVDSYWVRSTEMAITTVAFSLFTGVHTWTLMRECATPQEIRKSIFSNAKKMWKNRNILAKLGKSYIDYYHPSFHPSQKESGALRSKGLQRLSTMLGDSTLYDAAM